MEFIVGGVEATKEAVRQWYEDGAQIIDGCCRTTPGGSRAIAGWAQEDNLNL